MRRSERVGSKPPGVARRDVVHSRARSSLPVIVRKMTGRKSDAGSSSWPPAASSTRRVVTRRSLCSPLRTWSMPWSVRRWGSNADDSALGSDMASAAHPLIGQSMTLKTSETGAIRFAAASTSPTLSACSKVRRTFGISRLRRSAADFDRPRSQVVDERLHHLDMVILQRAHRRGGVARFVESILGVAADHFQVAIAPDAVDVVDREQRLVGECGEQVQYLDVRASVEYRCGAAQVEAGGEDLQSRTKASRSSASRSS